MNNNTKQIMKELDNWVSRHGNGKYGDENIESARNYENYGIPEIPGIQQIRKEIKEFVFLILEEDLSNNILEIGLGYYGSTHFLWRLLFDHVISIEKLHNRVRTFGENTRSFYGKWVLDDNKSSFIIGSSNNSKTVLNTYKVCDNRGIDLLFIDGDHEYESVLTDWLLYNPLVKKGGIVAFHDVESKDPEYGVSMFIDRLSKGKIDNKKRVVKRIVHSNYAGIGYYKKV